MPPYKAETYLFHEYCVQYPLLLLRKEMVKKQCNEEDWGIQSGFCLERTINDRIPWLGKRATERWCTALQNPQPAWPVVQPQWGCLNAGGSCAALEDVENWLGSMQGCCHAQARQTQIGKNSSPVFLKCLLWEVSLGEEGEFENAPPGLTVGWRVTSGKGRAHQFPSALNLQLHWATHWLWAVLRMEGDLSVHAGLWLGEKDQTFS